MRVEVDGEPTYLGFSFTQFAMPVIAGPGARLRLPPGAEPALASRRSGCSSPGPPTPSCCWRPLDHPHEQVIAVADGALRWGWHGDLDDVPAGFSTTLGVFTAARRSTAAASGGATACALVVLAGR